MSDSRRESGPGAAPEVAADILELLQVTDDGVDVPAEGKFPAVRLMAPTLETSGKVFAHLNARKELLGRDPNEIGGTLLTLDLSIRVDALAATMPGLGNGPHAVKLARELGNDSKIIRAAFDLCGLPESYLDGKRAAQEGNGAEAPEAAFAARPTK